MTFSAKVAIAASAIFKIVDTAEDPNNHDTYLGKSGVAWVLRFGGLCTLVCFCAFFSSDISNALDGAGWRSIREDGASHEDGEGDASPPGRDEFAQRGVFSMNDCTQRSFLNLQGTLVWFALVII